MGVNMTRCKFTTSTSGNEVRWYKRDYASKNPYIIYVNGRLVCEVQYYGDANRAYEGYAAM